MDRASNGGAMTTGPIDPTPCCGEKEYIPPKVEILQRNEIRIRFLSIGCVITVGCKEIPFTNLEAAMGSLEEYVKDPHTATKKWNEIFNSNK